MKDDNKTPLRWGTNEKPVIQMRNRCWYCCGEKDKACNGYGKSPMEAYQSFKYDVVRLRLKRKRVRQCRK